MSRSTLRTTYWAIGLYELMAYAINSGNPARPMPFDALGAIFGYPGQLEA
jgi:hypothetical protein